jgi:hypothetical protein
MIEQFSLEHRNFFDESSYQVRWERLRSIYSKDYSSFRVLFVVETLGLLDKWREPTTEELKTILSHKMARGQVAIRIGRVIDLFQPVWPLEVAKYDFLVYRATWDSDFRRKFLMTGIRSYASALVQAWWAFETLMNDLASIITTERRTTLDPTTISMIEEKRPTIDKAGALSYEPYYQPLLPRLQFIYSFLTGEPLDRGGAEWRNLVELKETRDAFVHRIGKQLGDPGTLWNDSILVNGFSAVRSVLARVFTKTPELAARFVYKYLAFWSCGSESPFIWDGSEGDSFYLGQGSVERETVISVFAPMPGSFNADRSAEPTPPARANQ